MKITVQTGNVVGQLGIEAGYRAIREAGFEGIDWNIDHGRKAAEVNKGKLEDCVFEMPMDQILEYYSDQVKAIKENGLVIGQAHAPFPAYVEGFEELDRRVIPIYENCIRLCQEVGYPALVIHGISQRVNCYTLTKEELWQKNMALYEALIPVLKETDVVVCLENLFTHYEGVCYPGTCIDPNEAVAMIDALNEKAGKECFGFCFDVGHFNLFSKDFAGYLGRLGKRVKTLHIHDNSGKDDNHKMPYNGTVCWKDFYEALKAIGYEGNLNFETFNQYQIHQMEAEFIPVFLKAIAEIGALFKKKILE